MIKRFITSFFCLLALFVAGCSEQMSQLSFEKIGQSVLGGVGIDPGIKSYMDAGQHMIKAVKGMSREEEYYLGRAVSAKILSRYQASTDFNLLRYINTVGTTVARFSDAPETFGGYHFMLLETNQVNAISAPGGYVFITRGLLKLLPDEDSLAAVLAHEVTHIVKQHGLKSISQSNLTAALADAGKIACKLNCNDVLQQAGQVFGATVDDLFKNLIDKGYSRDQELEADSGAVEILYRAGYSARSVQTVMEIENLQSANESGWLKSHPGLSKRISAIKNSKFLGKPNSSELGFEARKTRFAKAVKLS